MNRAAKARIRQLVGMDPVSRMLAVFTVAAAFGLCLSIVRAAPVLPALWADSTVWRVHHVPLLATRREQEEVRRSDALQAELQRLIAQARKGWSQSPQSSQ